MGELSCLEKRCSYLDRESPTGLFVCLLAYLIN